MSTERVVYRLPQILAAAVLSAALLLPGSVLAQNWAELTATQREALGPLMLIWDSLPESQQEHFLKLAKHFPGLSAEKKQRWHEKLVDWSKLTPEQRQKARELHRALSLVPEKQQAEVRKMVREQNTIKVDDATGDSGSEASNK